MFLVWRGLGILAPLCIFLQLVLLAFVPTSFPITAQHAFKFFIVLASTYGIWYLGRYLNTRPGRVLIDPETNERVELRSRHDFFWIPLEYWAFVGAVVSMFIVFATSSKVTP